MKKANALAFVLSILALVGCTETKPIESANSRPSASPVEQSDTAHPVESAPSSNTSKTPDSSSTGEPQKQMVDVTFDLNYKGAPKASVVRVEKGKPVTEPEDPTRNGKVFTGWAIAKDSPQIYDFTYPVESELTLYASWGETGAEKIKAYTFEAEYCPCITDGQGMTGSTYSGGTAGQGLIQEDIDHDADASNHFWVHFLYNRGDNLIFDIQSDKAIDNAMIYMRLSAEYHGPMEISPDMYPIKLNGVSISYESVLFPVVPIQGSGWLPFQDFLLGINLSLVKGNNKIEMITDNDQWLYGTAMSTAPMVDCLKFYVPDSTTLTWPSAKYSNIVFEDE